MKKEWRSNSLNLKCDPQMVAVLNRQSGFVPVYHMNKKHWLTIFLDGSVSKVEIMQGQIKATFYG